MAELSLQEALNQAQLALKQRQLAQAERLYKAIVQAVPQNAQAHYGLSVLALETNKAGIALEYLQVALKAEPEQVAYRVQQLKIAYFDAQYKQVLQQASAWIQENPQLDYLWLAGNAARALGQWNRAAELYQQGLQIQAQHPALMAEMAVLECIRPNTSQAQKTAACTLLENLVTSYPQSLLILKQTIYVHLLNQKINQVEPWLTQALTIKAYDPELIALQAKYYHLKGDLKKAEYLFNQAISVYRRTPLAFAHLGWLFKELNRISDAILCFGNAVNMQMGLYQEAEQLAYFLYERRQNTLDARKSLAKALATNPGAGRLYAQVALMLLIDNDEQNASQLCERGLVKAQDGLQNIYLMQAVLAARQKQWEAMYQLLNQAQGQSFYGLASYALALHKSEQKDWPAAEKALKQALQQHPEMPIYQRLMASILGERKKAKPAIRLLDALLLKHPKDAQARLQIISLLASQQEIATALKHEALLMELNPEVAEKQIKARYEQDPKNARYCYDYGKVLSKQPERLDEAIEYLDQCLALENNYYRAALLKANVLKQQEKFAAAKTAFEFCIQIEPERNNAYIGLAQVLLALDNWDQAEAMAKKALELNLDHNACTSLALTLKELGGHDQEVLALYDQAIQLKPEDPVAYWNKSLIYRYSNRLPECMALYHYGFEAGPRKPYRKFGVPEWDGKSSLKGKRILCWREQGVGDEIRFATYYQDLINTGATCIFEVSNKLKPLFRRSFPHAEIIVQSGGDDLTRTDIDYHLPAGTLMKHFPKEYPLPPVYKNHFILSEDHLQKWQARFAELGTNLKVGLSWRSGVRAKARDKYIMSVDDLAPLFKLPNITWINLQYDDCADEIAEIQQKFAVTVHKWDDLDQKDDLDQTAAMTSLLDLMVTAPTSVADMGAALGIPTLYWYIGATMETGAAPEYNHLMYPALQFKRHHTQPKSVIAQQIADFINAHYLS